MDITNKMNRCQHNTSEFCLQCFKSKGKDGLKLQLYLSRVKDKIYVAVDGNFIEIHDFGINPERFHILGCEIDRAVQAAMEVSE